MFTLGTTSIARFGILVIGVFAVPLIASADPPTATPLDDGTKQEESVEVRYARAHLKLAQLDLERLLAEDKRHPGVLPARMIDSVRKHVAIDKEQLRVALQGPDGLVHQVYIRSAKVAVELAEADLQRKKEASKKLPGKLTEIEAERAAAVLDVAKLHLEITEKKEASLSSLMYLQWQIEMLRNQVLELQVQMETHRR